MRACVALVALGLTPMHRGWAACPVQPDELERALVAAEALAQDLSAGPFHEAAAVTEADVACLATAIPAADVPRYLRVLGLRAYMDHDNVRAAQAFAAARALEPSQAFLRDVLPEDNPFWTTYRALDVADGTYVDLPAATLGSVLLDGSPSGRRPAAWPTLFQYIGEDGIVRTTVLLWPGDALPNYPHAEPVDPTVVQKGKLPPHASRTALASGGVAGLIAGGLYVAATLSRQDYEGASSTNDVEQLHDRTNGLVIGSIGVGAIGLGLGVVAVASGRW